MSRDPKSFCQYHRNIRHDTQECRTLRKLVERTFEQGKLLDLVADESKATSIKGKVIVNHLGASTSKENDSMSLFEGYLWIHIPNKYVTKDDVRHVRYTE